MAMMTNVEIAGSLRGAGRLTKKGLAEAAKYFALRSSRRAKMRFCHIDIILQNDEESNEAHKAIMDVEGATDVITQGYDAMPPEEPGVYGELYVNLEQAARVASSIPNWSVEDEILLYVAHGMDHLSGEDDLTEAQYARMRRRELGWLRDWKKGNH